jgi:putative addiction module component (TIGR02574 family)
MSYADVAEILKLPAEVRLRIIELIWQSLAANPVAVPLGDAHRTDIDERLADHEPNPDEVATRDEVLTEARQG